jgi:hypothetical protein
MLINFGLDVERRPNEKETTNDVQVKYRGGREGGTTLEEKRKGIRISTDSLLFVYIRVECKV